MVYLCNPNNPTGRTVEPALLRAVAARCADAGARLIVDECFVDFLQDAARHTLKGLLAGSPASDSAAGVYQAVRGAGRALRLVYDRGTLV